MGGESFDRILARIERGVVKALILVEWDALTDYPDQSRVQRALEQLDLLVVLDHLNSTAAQKADILLPTTTIYESGGLFINQEGRLQQTNIAYRGGESVLHVGRGSHPPRTYSDVIPGADPLPGWQILTQLGQDLVEPNDAMAKAMEILMPIIGLEAGTPIPDEGIRVSVAPDKTGRFEPFTKQKGEETDDGFLLLPVAVTFGTEALSRVSPPLQQVEKPPCLTMHSEDASQLNVKDGDQVKVETPRGEMILPVRLNKNMARGVLVSPRHHGLNWQILDADQDRFRITRVSKVSE